MSFIDSWANAIASFEGFNTPGSRPARDNNPGDLKYAGQAGATGQDPQGFAVFPDATTGMQALYHQLNLYLSEFPGYSIYQIMEHYLGQNISASGGETTSQGNSTTYGNFVAAAIGVDPSTTLGQLAAGTAAATPAGAVAPADGSSGDLPMLLPDDGGDPGTNGMLLLLLGGALLLWLIGSIGGWDS